MIPKSYAHLLFNAVRETLETMAFAEVIPTSIRIGDEEFDHSNGLDDFVLSDGETGAPDAVPAPEDSWGTAAPATADNDSWSGDSWGDDSQGTDSRATAPVDDWGTSAGRPVDDWGEPTIEVPETDDVWGSSCALTPPKPDPWGDTKEENSVGGISIESKTVNFEELVGNQDGWIWSCMRVNSPDINTVWFIVSKELAMELARNMYAGEDLELDSPIIRDLVAELTNVLGGRLMLLLENMGGKFTLTVPEIGIGFPQLPDDASTESVLCRVLVDGEYNIVALQKLLNLGYGFFYA